MSAARNRVGKEFDPSVLSPRRPGENLRLVLERAKPPTSLVDNLDHPRDLRAAAAREAARAAQTQVEQDELEREKSPDGRLVALLHRLANNGAALPGNLELSDLLDIDLPRVPDALARLEARGLIVRGGNGVARTITLNDGRVLRS